MGTLCHLVPELLPSACTPVTLADWFAEVDSFVLINTSLVGGQCCWLKVANTAARRPGQTQQSSGAMAGLLVHGGICDSSLGFLWGWVCPQSRRASLVPSTVLACQGGGVQWPCFVLQCQLTEENSKGQLLPRCSQNNAVLSSVGAEHQGSLELHD